MSSIAINNSPLTDILQEERVVEQQNGPSVIPSDALPLSSTEEYYARLDARFGPNGAIFRSEGNDYRALKRVVAYLLPPSVYLTWEMILIFHMTSRAPFPSLSRLAYMRGVSIRTIQLNVQYLEMKQLLWRKPAVYKGHPVLEFHLEALYALAYDYLQYERSSDFLDWHELTYRHADFITPELSRFLIYDKIVRYQPRGRKPRGPFVSLHAVVEKAEAASAISSKGELVVRDFSTPEPVDSTHESSLYPDSCSGSSYPAVTRYCPPEPRSERGCIPQITDAPSQPVSIPHLSQPTRPLQPVRIAATEQQCMAEPAELVELVDAVEPEYETEPESMVEPEYETKPESMVESASEAEVMYPVEAENERSKRPVFLWRTLQQDREEGVVWRNNGTPLPAPVGVVLRKVSLEFNDEFPRSSRTHAANLYTALAKSNIVQDAYFIPHVDTFFANMLEVLFGRLRNRRFVRMTSRGLPNGMPLFFTELNQEVSDVLERIVLQRQEEAIQRFQRERSHAQQRHSQQPARRIKPRDYDEQNCVEGQISAVPPPGQERSADDPPCAGVLFSVREMSTWYADQYYENLTAEELVLLGQHYGAQLTEEQVASVLADPADLDLIDFTVETVRISAYYDMVDNFVSTNRC
ncbi:hypothetical protein ccbrp13_21950 [Ktedonobacteria bacterium brp13]|nr:hypothetical protein ccbrp13_21950 [Ktedonobacteria bacterium brp13]